MRLFHLADLHLGIRLFEYSMLEDQAYFLDRLFEIIEAERPDALLLAGDIYDTVTPSAETVHLLDGFLTRVSALSVKVFLLAGNHDSADRLSFGAALMERSGVYVSPAYRAPLLPVTLTDAFGEVEVWMLPFVRPAEVRRVYPEERIEGYTDAVTVALSVTSAREGVRRVLLSHQLVTDGAEDSFSVGGTDNVELSVYRDFSYVALGHLHTARTLSDGHTRYAGAPLAYTFGEVGREKSFTDVFIGADGHAEITDHPITPLRPLLELRGSFAELMKRDTPRPDAYYRVLLTDEEDVPDALAELRKRYPHIFHLSYDNKRTRADAVDLSTEVPMTRDPLSLFSELYEKQNGRPLSEEERDLLSTLTAEVFSE